MSAIETLPVTRPRHAPTVVRPVAAEVAALCCLVAAGIHLAVVQPHAIDWGAYGAFFLATAIGQAALGLLVWHRQPLWLLLVGVAGNLAILGMYILSRTNGPP